ncbi:TPA: SDR family oxidoreductase [Salmonella enterica subsp. enterica serovar Eastbourne]|nr:SDR family oxidoreductase [Salmonella enterica subsp. enterica serovar Eastbourne]
MSKRNALITGGARGIGASTAKMLAQDGYRVIINYVNSVNIAENLVDEIVHHGGEAYAIQADVRNDAQLEVMFARIDAEFGGVDILVSNANMHFVAQPFSSLSWQDFSQKLNDEMHAAFMSAQIATQHMKKRQFGRIVFVSSTLSEMPAPNFVAHGTAKGALDSFCKYLAQELGPEGITVNIVAPGLVETDATKDAPAEFKDVIREHTPVRRIATPDDVGNTIRFLASEASRHITGVYVPVSGGAYMP